MSAKDVITKALEHEFGTAAEDEASSILDALTSAGYSVVEPTAEAEAERLREALRLIELLGYREGEELGWVNAHMRGVATSALQGDDFSPYWRLFPQHRPRAALAGQAEAKGTEIYANALRTLAEDRDIANEQIHGLAEERERWKERAERAEAEAERLREAFRAEREENLWNAFNIGSIRSDGKWVDCGLSDAEWLVRELGLDQDANGHDPEEIKRRISEAAARAALEEAKGTLGSKGPIDHP